MKVVSKNIEMIAYFKEDGNIEPIRFRLEEGNKQLVVKIEKIIKVDLEKFCGNNMMVFTCTSVINNLEKIFEIKYDIGKCKWILFKI